MLKGLVVKLVTGKKNAPLESHLLNFYRYLYAHSPRVADIVAANTRVGITKRYQKLLKAKDHGKMPCIYESGVTETVK